MLIVDLRWICGRFKLVEGIMSRGKEIERNRTIVDMGLTAEKNVQNKSAINKKYIC